MSGGAASGSGERARSPRSSPRTSISPPPCSVEGGGGGREGWGGGAASRKYFGHPASSLSLEEAAGLAGTLPFPLTSNPGYRPGRMRWRQSMIVRRMRGENVEVPPVLDTPPDSTADTTRARPDTARDTTRLPPDTIPDTLRVSRPGGAASPGSYSWQDRPSPPARPPRGARGA